jgi:hypothetical protein
VRLPFINVIKTLWNDPDSAYGKRIILLAGVATIFTLPVVIIAWRWPFLADQQIEKPKYVENLKEAVPHAVPAPDKLPEKLVREEPKPSPSVRLLTSKYPYSMNSGTVGVSISITKPDLRSQILGNLGIITAPDDFNPACILKITDGHFNYEQTAHCMNTLIFTLAYQFTNSSWPDSATALQKDQGSSCLDRSSNENEAKAEAVQEAVSSLLDQITCATQKPLPATEVNP